MNIPYHAKPEGFLSVYIERCARDLSNGMSGPMEEHVFLPG